MKNFFKNVFQKIYPFRTSSSSQTKEVYAGPETMNDKRMKCVYAGPDMMRKRKPGLMEKVYAGPPIRNDEATLTEGVYRGPENNTGEDDTPMEDVYMGPEPDEDEPCIEDTQEQDAERITKPVMMPVYAGPVQMNMGPQAEPVMVSAYAGPPDEISHLGKINVSQNEPNMMMVYWGPAGPQNSGINGFTGLEEALKNSNTRLMICPCCGNTDIDPSDRAFKKCGAVLDLMNADKGTVNDPGTEEKEPEGYKF
ncbi:MAG: hypothetical protein K6G45_02670 [Lachnospiraceae bacterium]|nr:hypothetical protein [Lachnospiraceae bacterium]